MTAVNYFGDASEYQPVYDESYPYPVAAFRFHTGYKVDDKAAANWAYHKAAIAAGRTRVLFAYVVFIPGQLTTVMAGLRSVFGTSCPTDRLVIMIDMESGKGFAGPGNHSVEANTWADVFAGYTGTYKRVDAYANGGDFANLWPQIDPRLKKHVAKYSAVPPVGAYAWQYYGAQPFDSPPGAPRGCPPFGANVDMNVIYKSIEQIEADYGIPQPAPTPEPTPPPSGDDEMPNTVIYSVNQSTAPAGTPAVGIWAQYPNCMGYIHVASPADVTTLINGGAVNAGVISYQQHQIFLAADLSSASTVEDDS